MWGGMSPSPRDLAEMATSIEGAEMAAGGFLPGGCGGVCECGVL